MLTIVLKLYNPSAKKCRIIDEAMLNYTCAYQYLLDRAYEEFDSIYGECHDSRGRYTSISVAKWINRDISRELNRFCVEPFKDSLKLDFSMTMAGYLNLRKIQKNVKFPKSCSLRPIYFCRSDTKRDYCLLYDAKRERYFVKLYLMNRKNALIAKKEPCENRILTYIHKGNTSFEDSGSSRRYIIAPLAFGKWQEGYLKQAISNPEIIKTARLMKKNGQYFLAVNIEEKHAEKLETTSVMGISRGIENILSYTLVNFMGDEICRGSITHPSTSGLDRNLNDAQMHGLANAIVELALKHNSRVVMAAMTDKGDKLEWMNECGEIYAPVLTRHSYNQISKIADYKLEAKGLPPSVKISPIGIFYRCPVCGTSTRKNRFNRDILICISCGATLKIEYLGSGNLAGRYLEYNRGELEIRTQKTEEGIRLINDIIGLDFCTKDPLKGLNDISNEIERLIDAFYCSISKGANVKNIEFRRKYSLIRRIEKEENLLKLIKFI